MGARGAGAQALVHHWVVGGHLTASGHATGRASGHASRTDHLEWGEVARALAERLRTPVARAAAEAGADGPHDGTTGSDGSGYPPADVDGARRGLLELDGLELSLAHLERSALPPELADVHDVSRPLAEASRGAALELSELARVTDLLSALAEVDRLRRAAGHAAAADPEHAAAGEALASALGGAAAEPELLERLGRSIERESPDAEPTLADSASPALAAARQRLRALRGELMRRADALVRRGELGDALADRFFTEREGRIVLPIKAGMLPRSDVAGGIIHGSSSRGQTLFVEPPQLVEDNNRLRQAELAERAEVRRVIEALSYAVGQCAESLAAGLRAIVELDRIGARLRLSTDLGAHRPEVAVPRPGEALRLPAARHPLMVLAGTQVVPNDLELRIGSILVVSGPNAGGKTVALKTAGLCVLLASAGIRVPAGPGARVPLFRHIVTDVGDDQSIARNLSTFSAHVGHVAEALDAAASDGPGTLVLIDEVAAGTDPQQGSALAEAVLHALVDAGASGIVTTHYERLKLLAAEDPRFVNAAVGFDLQALSPTFRLTVGVPGSSSAIAVARRLGLPAEVLAAAEAIAGEGGRRVDVLLGQIEAERVRLAEARARLEDETAEIARERLRLAARDQRELEAAEQRRAKAHRAAASELHRLEDEIKRRRKRLAAAPADATLADPTNHPTDRAREDAQGFAREARGDLARAAPPVVPPPVEPVASLAVGDRVQLGALQAVGEVLAVKGDRVTVQLGHAKVTVPRRDLATGPAAKASRPAASSPPRPASDAGRHFGADARPIDPGLDDVADLRGQRVDEAITQLEVFLDRAIACDREVVVLRHGHGSGALRKVVREHLPRLRHVVTHRPGLPPEGGDAVTVVWVRA